MPKLKVRPLEFWQDHDLEDLVEDFKEVPADFPLIGRNGYYCLGEAVWFEIDGRGFFPHKYQRNQRASFSYVLTVNDEAILPDKEVEAMRTVLKTTKNAGVKKSIHAALSLHDQALSLRETGRRARMSMISFMKTLENSEK